MLVGNAILAAATLLPAAAASALNWQRPWEAPSPIPQPDDYLKAKPKLTEEIAHKVNVSLYVMSRCPDARLCERVFEEVLNTPGMIDKVDLSVDYIGKPSQSAPYGVECMHGDLECAGNAHQLCVRAYAPLKQFWAALSCMNYGNFPGSIGTVELTRRCTEATKIKWWETGLGRCVQGRRAEREAKHALHLKVRETMPHRFLENELDAEADAEDLEHLGEQAIRRLRESVRKTIADGVTKSCTIRISSASKKEPRQCIVDGGVWKGCDDGHTAADFVRVIEKEYKEINQKKD